MKFLSEAKKEIICALFNYGCRGCTEFRPESEAFLCDNHHEWVVAKSWKDEYIAFVG